MSLADELLADLEEDDNDAELLLMEKQQMDEEREGNEMEIEQEPVALQIDYRPADSIRELCKIRDSEETKRILEQLREFAKKPRNSSEMIGNVESDPEYQLIVQANSLAVDIDNEIGRHGNSFLVYTPVIIIS